MPNKFEHFTTSEAYIHETYIKQEQIHKIFAPPQFEIPNLFDWGFLILVVLTLSINIT